MGGGTPRWVRADAARNLELLLTTGARMLAEDPAASIAAIAAAAGVDRRTVYRRFTAREELLAAVYQARLDAIEAAIEAARLPRRRCRSPCTGTWRRSSGSTASGRSTCAACAPSPPSASAAASSSPASTRSSGARTDEGLLRADLPAGWVYRLLIDLLHLASHEAMSPLRPPTCSSEPCCPASA